MVPVTATEDEPTPDAGYLHTSFDCSVDAEAQKKVEEMISSQEVKTQVRAMIVMKTKYTTVKLWSMQVGPLWWTRFTGTTYNGKCSGSKTQWPSARAQSAATLQD